MTQLSPAEWKRLEALATQVGVSPEQVGMVRRRMETNRAHPGHPYTMLIGRPDGGLEVLLAGWIGSEAIQALKQAGEKPLILGREPEQVRPTLSNWPALTWKPCEPGHLIAWRSPGKPGADLLAQLGSLGYVDQLVLVTRLGKPLDQVEREMARSLSPLAVTARVLVVGLAGEEPTADDLAEISAYAAAQMRQAGFLGGRYLGAGVWFAVHPLDRPGLVSDVGRSLEVDATAVVSHRTGMFQQGISHLLADLSSRCEQSAEPALASIAPEEAERLTRELASFLADLGRELHRRVAGPLPVSTETLRTLVLDKVRGWRAYVTVPGLWMKFVERLRPGTEVALLAETESALVCLEYQPAGKVTSQETQATMPATSVIDRLIMEAKRLGAGLVCGLAAYYGVVALLTGPPATEDQRPPALPALVVTLIGMISLVLVTILGYAAARWWFPLPPRSPNQAQKQPEQSPWGWEQVESRVTTWFAERMRSHPLSPVEELQQLASRLNVGENRA